MKNKSKENPTCTGRSVCLEGVSKFHLLFYAQSPDFHKLGLCYNLKILYL